MYQDPNLIYTPQQQVQESVYTPKVTPGRVQGTVSDYREARLVLSPQGIHIDGRAVLPQEQQIPILIVSWFITGPLLTAILLEYAIRQNRAATLAWGEVTEIVLEPHKQRACLVYPNPKKPHKQFSLAFLLGPSYGEFAAQVQRLIPEKVHEGKIKGATSPIVWGFLILLISILIFAFMMAVFSPRN